MKQQAHSVLIGLATATIVGCSSAPASETPGAGGTAGANAAGTGGATGTAGTVGAGGTLGAGAGGTAGTGGTMGAGGTTGAAGSAGASGSGGGTGCPPNVLGHCNSDTTQNTYAGFTLALAEEFDAPIDLDTDPVWTWSDGGPPEGQARFQKQAITFANGLMIITATNPGVPSSISYAEPDQGKTTSMATARTVASGEFRTKYNNYRYGRYEVRVKAPAESTGADGNYLATMFVFRTPKWQDWNEIDLELEANIKNSIAFNVINAQGRVTYPGDKAAAGNTPEAAPFTIRDAHTYAFEWTPTSVVWYVDGVMFHSYDGSGGAAIPSLSAKIMMNLWVFASADNFGNPANNQYPFHSEYEYFRFYKWDKETTYPMADPNTRLPAGDVDYSQNNGRETTYP